MALRARLLRLDAEGDRVHRPPGRRTARRRQHALPPEPRVSLANTGTAPTTASRCCGQAGDRHRRRRTCANASCVRRRRPIRTSSRVSSADPHAARSGRRPRAARRVPDAARTTAPTRFPTPMPGVHVEVALDRRDRSAVRDGEDLGPRVVRGHALEGAEHALRGSARALRRRGTPSSLPARSVRHSSGSRSSISSFVSPENSPTSISRRSGSMSTVPSAICRRDDLRRLARAQQRRRRRCARRTRGAPTPRAALPHVRGRTDADRPGPASGPGRSTPTVRAGRAGTASQQRDATRRAAC